MEDYKEKLRLAKEALDSGSYDKETIEYIFPELKESEDKIIRKDIIQFLRDYYFNRLSAKIKLDTLELWSEWLEKQGEQKPAWSDKDGEILLKMMFAFTTKVFPSSKECDSFIDFLKSLKDKVQPKQNWSEEDEYNFNWIINDYKKASQTAISSVWEGRFKTIVDWLKSLKERYTWKPSNEQMEVLVWCKPLFADPKSKGILESLIEDLKKLKGE